MPRYVLIATFRKDVVDENSESLKSLSQDFKKIGVGESDGIQIIDASDIDGPNGPDRNAAPTPKFRRSEFHYLAQRYYSAPKYQSSDGQSPVSDQDQLSKEIRFPKALTAQFCRVFESLEALRAFQNKHGTAMTKLCEYTTIIRETELKSGG
jgi:hypothetical protein